MSVWPGIKTEVEYNGKTIYFFKDIDGFCWINDESAVFEDGSPVTVEGLMEFLSYYGKDMVKPRDQRSIREDLVFFDGNEAVGNGSYGDVIRIDPSGKPLVKIEDGKIISAYEMCSCERKYQYGESAFIRVRSKEEHDAFRQKLTGSGEFIEIRQGKPYHEGLFRTVNGVAFQYKCTKCGAVWDLPAYVKVKDKSMAGLPSAYKLSRMIYVSLKEDKEKTNYFYTASSLSASTS